MVGTEADHSLDSTTASRRSRTAATNAAALMMAVTGTCPLRNPSSAERRTRGSMVRTTRLDGQPGHCGGVLNGGEALSRAARRHRVRRRGGPPASDATVTMESMPAAERDEGPAGGGLEGDRRHGAGVRAFDAQSAQVEAIAVGELTQAVDVEAAEEVPLRHRRREVAQVDHGGGRGLVVRDAREQVEDAHGGHDCRVVPVAARFEGEALGEGVGVRGVAADDDRARRVDGVTVVAEPVGWWHAGWGVARRSGPAHATAQPAPDRPQSARRASRAKRPHGRRHAVAEERRRRMWWCRSR